MSSALFPANSGQATANLLKSLLTDLSSRCTAMKKMLAEPDIAPPADDHALTLSRKLSELRRDINALLQDPAFGAPQLLKQQFGQQTRFTEQLVIIEARFLPVVLRFGFEDARLCALVARFIRELGMETALAKILSHAPPSPLVSAFSAEYYFTLPEFGLIFAPALETQSLLAWPDMVHEIVHWFFVVGKIDPESKFMIWLRQHIANEKRRFIREQRPGDIGDYDWVVEQWRDRWLIEFCTDLVSTYLLGPSYAWQHLRLCCQESSDPYSPSLLEGSTHPADEIRFRMMLQMLNETGWSDEANAVQERWQHWESVTGITLGGRANYDFCYPKATICRLVEELLTLCQFLNLRAFSSQDFTDNTQTPNSLTVCIHQGWYHFLENPDSYTTWEQGQLAQIWAIS